MKETQPPCLVNDIFCYEGKTHMGSNRERKQHLVITDGGKSTGRKVSLATVFANITRRGALLSLHPYS